jgi:membrane protein
LPPFPTVELGWWPLISQAGTQWVTHKDARLGAALAYYSVFSIGPLIVIAIAIAGLLFEQGAVRGEVTNTLKGLLGDTGAQAINAMLVDASKPREGILAAAIGLGTLIFAAVGVGERHCKHQRTHDNFQKRSDAESVIFNHFG